MMMDMERIERALNATRANGGPIGELEALQGIAMAVSIWASSFQNLDMRRFYEWYLRRLLGIQDAIRGQRSVIGLTTAKMRHCDAALARISAILSAFPESGGMV